MILPLPLFAALPFTTLVLALAVLPAWIPSLWSRHAFQAFVAAACTVPVVLLLAHHGHLGDLEHVAKEYLSFVITIGALYTVTGNIHVSGDIEATPRVNVAFLLAGSVLASLIGTTGASVLLIRPLLRTNRQREHKWHIVPMFILAVANAGGLLTPLGDPPLLVGYLSGVPFTWTLRLFPIWALYVGFFAVLMYVLDRRAHALEPGRVIARDKAEIEPIKVLGLHNVLGLGAIVGAAMLPTGYREGALLVIAAASYFATPAVVREKNSFGFGPILEVAILFAGLFLCLAPIEKILAAAAPALPLQHGWQLFWASGALSSVLDNAPTYAAFAALARGMAHGTELVGGITPGHLAAVSIGTVVMGATTYIGNGPNLIVKAIAESHEYKMLSFARYAGFALLAMLPVHLIVTAVLIWMER